MSDQNVNAFNTEVNKIKKHYMVAPIIGHFLPFLSFGNSPRYTLSFSYPSMILNLLTNGGHQIRLYI